MAFSLFSNKSRKIAPIRRKVLEFFCPTIPWHHKQICWESVHDSFQHAYQRITRLKVKHYKKSKISFNATCLRSDMQSIWVDKAMKVLYKQNRADPKTRFKLRLDAYLYAFYTRLAPDRIVRKKMIKMKNISLFSLHLSSHYLFGNEELDLVQHILKRQKYLKETNLSFERIDKIDDGEVAKICHIISKANRNTFLGLTFSENNQLTRKGFHNIFYQLTRMNQLQSLCLEFKECSSFSFGLVEAEIEHYLKRMKNLRALLLDIHGYAAIELKSLNIFKKRLSSMHNLKKLTVNKERVHVEPFSTQMKIKSDFYMFVFVPCISYLFYKYFIK